MNKELQERISLIERCIIYAQHKIATGNPEDIVDYRSVFVDLKNSLSNLLLENEDK